jgi:hypothetical protein
LPFRQFGCGLERYCHWTSKIRAAEPDGLHAPLSTGSFSSAVFGDRCNRLATDMSATTQQLAATASPTRPIPTVGLRCRVPFTHRRGSIPKPPNSAIGLTRHIRSPYSFSDGTPKRVDRFRAQRCEWCSVSHQPCQVNRTFTSPLQRPAHSGGPFGVPTS